MNIALSRLFSVALIIFSIYAFMHANIDFSYDYSVYMYYTESTYRIDMAYINRSVISYFPFPYVLVPPYATFEYGYVALTIFLGYVGFSVVGSYAVIGATSIAVRAFVLERAGAGFFFNVLMALCYITLFEANAIRVGISSSIALVALLFFLKEKYIIAAFVAFLSFLLHIQSLIYVITFLAGLAIYIFTSNKPYLRVFLIVLGIFATFVAIPAINFPFGTKADDYLLRSSQATGFNIISISSLVVIFVSIYALPSVTRFVKGTHLVAWVSSLFAFSQATIFLIFGGIFADIGVRLWQFAFLIFAVSSVFLAKSVSQARKKVPVFNYALKFIYLCLAIQAVNVIIRYPLSNFFYPILPYNVIDYVRL